MSKFIDAVRAELLHERKVCFSPMLAVKKEYKRPTPDYDDLTEYCISVGWVQTGFCKPEELAPMLDNVIRALREAIYGDIKQRAIKLERAIYEQDRDTILSEIRDIMREVFGG
jgi:hypothetical protein